MNKTNFKFEISLRISHPTIDPQEITETLSITPSHSYMVGAKRVTPKGNEPPGVNKKTMWFFRIGGRSEGELGTVSDLVREMNNQLSSSRDFLQRLQESGGTIEYFIGWFSGFNSGEVLDWKLLKECADLRIDLSLDVYSNEQSTSE